MPMAIQEILLMGDPILRQVSEPVPPESIQSDEIQSLIKDLLDTVMTDTNPDFTNVGLAAPQIGVPKRIFAVVAEDGTREDPEFDIYINPEIEHISDQVLTTEESCLSTPGLCGRVTRTKDIEISYLDPEGQHQKKKLSDLRAIITQHEFDHLDGVLWIDKVDDTKSLRFC